MMTPEFRVDMTDNRLTVRFEELPAQLRAALREKISELTHQLLAQVIAREPVRTGRMRSLTRAYVDEKRDWVRGRVRILGRRGPNQPARAFGALEYGAHRRFAVSAHRRSRRGGRSFMVSAYDRRANIHAMRFLRNPAKAMMPRARAELEAIILGTVRRAVQ